MAIKIEKISKTKEKISFLVKGINNSIANSIRRNVLEIPILAIDTVEFSKNDSALYDEMLAHRIGLIPLKSTKTFTPRKKCTCKGKGCLKCTAALKLKAKGPAMVNAKDLKTKGMEIVYPEMPIVLLAKDQELQLTAQATLGTGREHAKFTPGLVWFNSFPIIDIKGCSECTECIDICPRKAISFKDKKLIIDPLKCDICEACVEFLKNKEKCSISIKPSEEDFIFYIESFGQLKSEEIFVDAINSLDNNLKEFEKQIKKFKTTK
ncbi:MAG: DNA-directed RNA polymerase subunit D [Candidatus Pacearchaeota archaeon]|nr:MAG: DNA-directed RNA polymerase subunit D [Candidatus Pacearchaeota archaeon]